MGYFIEFIEVKFVRILKWLIESGFVRVYLSEAVTRGSVNSTRLPDCHFFISMKKASKCEFM